MLDFLKKMLHRQRPAEGNFYNPPPAWVPSPVAAPSQRGPALRQTNGRCIDVPLRPILDTLPLELQACIVQQDLGEIMVPVPLEKVLAQLSKGCVRITFAELRRAAPEVFTADPGRDSILVTLPLGEILTRMNPALITRRRAQREVQVPEEISSPFDVEGQSLVFTSEPARKTQQAESATERFTPKPPLPTGPGQVTLPPVHSPTAPLPMPARGAITSTPTPQPPSSLPLATPAIPLQRPTHAAASETSHTAAAPAPKPAPVAAQKEPQEAPIMVNLATLAESWPEAVRRDIVDLGLVDTQIALPFDAVGQALKQGRIVFTWRVLRSWITPGHLPTATPRDGQALELPLKVVAPLFLVRQQQLAKPQEKLKIDEDIPNLFFGFPQKTAATPELEAEAPRPEDTNFYVWDDVSESARVDESAQKKNASPGTRFMLKYATPNEVVSRAATLDGVAGALIALPDGLMVANRLPADVNGETLAAFLPHIFGKVSQCTKELRMGDLNNLNFTVGNVPWKIFRVNAIFFAAFGRSGQSLPTGQLAALAAELDHKPRS